jgi:hypothetical protein
MEKHSVGLNDASISLSLGPVDPRPHGHPLLVRNLADVARFRI